MDADSSAPSATTSMNRWARIALTLVLALLARHAFQDEYGAIPVLSDVDLARISHESIEKRSPRVV